MNAQIFLALYLIPFFSFIFDALLVIAFTIAILLMSGCGVKFQVVQAEASFTGWKAEENKNTVNVMTGNQSSLTEDNSNVIYESQKYEPLELPKVKQLRNERRMQ